MKLNQKQIEAVIALPGPGRYDHFIKVAADERSVWGLYSDGRALAGTKEGKPVFPLWPAREYADLRASGDWAGYEAMEIGLDELFDDLLPTLEERKTGVAIFDTPTDQGVLPDLGAFANDLREELAKME